MLYINIYTGLIVQSVRASERNLSMAHHSALSTLVHSYGLACQQRVLKRFLALTVSAPKWGSLTMASFLVNLHIYDSPFYPATAQSQCPMAIWRYSVVQAELRTLDGSGQL